MKSLALYIDKWYIVGAVCTDNVSRPLSLPNKEDRIWLYFHENDNDTISYGYGFKRGCLDNENHYYGDVFSKIDSTKSKFTRFSLQQPMREIFKMSNVFDDIRNNVETDGDIPTYISFSKDITPAARLVFRREFEKAKFKICETVARIDHLSLECASIKGKLSGEGYYLVLNSCNENLFYSIYKKTESIYVRISEDVLLGMGIDLRRRCLVEDVVSKINQSERVLQTRDDKEREYLRCSEFADDWLVRLDNSNPNIPIEITGIKLSCDFHKDYSVRVKKKEIEERTSAIVNHIVDKIAKFVKDSQLSHSDICGVVFLGNSFSNTAFKSHILSHYNIPNSQIVNYKSSDLSLLVSTYLYT